jgi:hypothetical protein
MTIRRAQFPAQVWDGTASDRDSRNLEIDPQHPTHDQIVAEVIAVQEFAQGLVTNPVVPLEAEAGVTVSEGEVIYIDVTGRLQKARNDTVAGSQATGMMIEDATMGVSGSYMTDGTHELADWTGIAGTADLTPGALYWLSDVPGQITTTAPTADGYYVVPIGRAVSTRKLDIEIGQPIRL